LALHFSIFFCTLIILYTKSNIALLDRALFLARLGLNKTQRSLDIAAVLLNGNNLQTEVEHPLHAQQT
jgi:hypothetical protein